MKQGLSRFDRIRGVLLGTAVGDALGLPAEGLRRSRIQKMFPGRWRHRFLPGRGMVSDDTDHMVFVAQSLLAHPDSPERFQRRFARCLRWWLLSLPPGIGWATLRAILRLWAGFRPSTSGVFSAGNGPAMRAAPIGAFFAAAPKVMDAYLEASTRITHTDPRALTGAKAVAHLTGWVIRENLNVPPRVEGFLAVLGSAGTDQEWVNLVSRVRVSESRQQSVREFAEELGLHDGITGYAYHTVPVSAYAWYRHFGDFETTLSAVLDCGGDTDTTGAIAGALAGAVVGEQGIPADWIGGLLDWPRGPHTYGAIADRMVEGSGRSLGTATVRYFWPGLLPRNLLFLAGVLLHAVRRLMRHG